MRKSFSLFHRAHAYGYPIFGSYLSVRTCCFLPLRPSQAAGSRLNAQELQPLSPCTCIRIYCFWIMFIRHRVEYFMCPGNNALRRLLSRSSERSSSGGRKKRPARPLRRERCIYVSNRTRPSPWIWSIVSLSF